LPFRRHVFLEGRGFPPVSLRSTGCGIGLPSGVGHRARSSPDYGSGGWAGRCGLFEAAGRRMAAGARGRPVALLGLVFVAGSAITAVLSLAPPWRCSPRWCSPPRSGPQLRPKPHMYGCTHLANSASLLLPASSLTNPLAFQASPWNHPCRVGSPRRHGPANGTKERPHERSAAPREPGASMGCWTGGRGDGRAPGCSRWVAVGSLWEHCLASCWW
jgi:hypothetical protein